MIEMSEALRWLNQFDRSHMNGTSRRLLAEARNLRTNDAAIQDMIRAALQQARSSPHDGLDYPETLLNCVDIEHDRRLLEPARDHAAAATSNYVRAKDAHGAAVAGWMFGIACFSLQDVDATYRNWKRSLKTFERYRDTNRHVPSSRGWYTQISIKMNQDLLTLPQESFSWLTRFDGSCISPINRDLIEIINRNLTGGSHKDVDRIIGALKERSKAATDPHECAEILAEAGLARFRMREIPLAIKDVKAAVRAYPPGSHQQACARWLLGAIQLWRANHQPEAITSWEKSLDEFIKLALTADQSNRPARKRWYRDRIAFMRIALKGKAAETFSGETRDSDSPGDRSSGTDVPPSPPPSPGSTADQRQNQQERYQYLCTLVGGDKEAANGCIEYERKRMPNASRGELIERAIERLLRDRR